ncbi:hypothetical protein N9K16_06290 [Alphaproteobacteria bacterium]|nr:hypothetical protein [Alphaproteobacteria bacterium]
MVDLDQKFTLRAIVERLRKSSHEWLERANETWDAGVEMNLLGFSDEYEAVANDIESGTLVIEEPEDGHIGVYTTKGVTADE